MSDANLSEPWGTHRALSTDNDHFRALSKSLSVQLTTLDTSTNGSRTARPVTRSYVLLGELDIPEAVGIDDKRPVTGRATPIGL
jgi:hypothetical protein